MILGHPDTNLGYKNPLPLVRAGGERQRRFFRLEGTSLHLYQDLPPHANSHGQGGESQELAVTPLAYRVTVAQFPHLPTTYYFKELTSPS